MHERAYSSHQDVTRTLTLILIYLHPKQSWLLTFPAFAFHTSVLLVTCPGPCLPWVCQANSTLVLYTAFLTLPVVEHWFLVCASFSLPFVALTWAGFLALQDELRSNRKFISINWKANDFLTCWVVLSIVPVTSYFWLTCLPLKFSP